MKHTVHAPHARIATVLCAGQIEMFGQGVEERRARIETEVWILPLTLRVTGMAFGSAPKEG